MSNFTVLDDDDYESQRQCAESWHSVFDLLIKHNPKFTGSIHDKRSGEKCVLDEIRRLQALEPSND